MCALPVSFAATVSTIAFAFYIQPIAMPMLREMPPGKPGYDILAWSMRLVILGALRCCKHNLYAPGASPIPGRRDGLQ